MIIKEIKKIKQKCSLGELNHISQGYECGPENSETLIKRRTMHEIQILAKREEANYEPKVTKNPHAERLGSKNYERCWSGEGRKGSA